MAYSTTPAGEKYVRLTLNIYIQGEKMRKKSNESLGNLTVEVYNGNSVVKVHNAIVKITGHYKPSGHFKKPVSFSANTKLHGFVKFTGIPLDMYKVEVSRKWYGRRYSHLPENDTLV